MSEWNLSDKAEWGTCSGGEEEDPQIFFKEDVKEFIKRLKEECYGATNLEIIDKLAGDALK